jgi:hypothetical protein
MKTATIIIRDKFFSWCNLLINLDDSVEFDLFVKNLKADDHYRNLRFETTFPELAQYIK